MSLSEFFMTKHCSTYAMLQEYLGVLAEKTVARILEVVALAATAVAVSRLTRGDPKSNRTVTENTQSRRPRRRRRSPPPAAAASVRQSVGPAVRISRPHCARPSAPRPSVGPAAHVRPNPSRPRRARPSALRPSVGPVRLPRHARPSAPPRASVVPAARVRRPRRLPRCARPSAQPRPSSPLGRFRRPSRARQSAPFERPSAPLRASVGTAARVRRPCSARQLALVRVRPHEAHG